MSAVRSEASHFRGIAIELTSALAYFVSLFGFCALVWLAGYALDLTFPEYRSGWLLLLSLATPLAYATAWLVLTTETLWQALRRWLALGGALAALMSLVVPVTVASIFLFPPAFAFAPALAFIAFGLGLRLVLRRQAATADGDPWRDIHGFGCMIAGLGFQTVWIIKVIANFSLHSEWHLPWVSSPADDGLVVAVFAVSFLPHAALAWAVLRKGPAPAIAPSRLMRRGGALLLSAWLGPAGLFAAASSTGWGLAWPAQYVHAKQAAMIRDQARLAEAGFRYDPDAIPLELPPWSIHPGWAPLTAGQHGRIWLGDQPRSVTTPPGWRLRASWRRDEAGAGGFLLTPDGDVAAPLRVVSGILVGGAWPEPDKTNRMSHRDRPRQPPGEHQALIISRIAGRHRVEVLVWHLSVAEALAIMAAVDGLLATVLGQGLDDVPPRFLPEAAAPAP